MTGAREQGHPPDRSEPARRVLPDALTSGPARAVLLVVALGLLGELAKVPVLSIFRASSARNDASTAGSPAETPRSELAAANQERIGEAELEGESTSRAPEGNTRGARAKSLFGGQDAELDLEAIRAEAPPIPLVDPSGSALDAFFARLARTQAKAPEAITRIAHFGDSMIVSDYVSSTLRRLLQERFGDAGHGYMLIANPWPAYYHDAVYRFATKGYRVSRIVGPKTEDGLYGLGGVTFRAGPGVLSDFGTAEGEAGARGTAVSNFVISYLASPGSGSLVLEVDGKEHSVVDTNAPTKAVRRYQIRVPDGPHRFRLGFRGAESRTFGVVLERDVPGVVLDALGVQGARIRFLDEQNDEHFRDELAWRDPALVIYQFGANESGDGYAYPMDEYQRTMGLVLEQAKKALPLASCLVVGAMDRARVENGNVTSMKIIELIVNEQRKAAERFGCAYFDTYASMGGWGSMPAWVKRGLGQADMTHPTGVGAERIGTWIYRALMQEYDRYLSERH